MFASCLRHDQIKDLSHECFAVMLSSASLRSLDEILLSSATVCQLQHNYSVC